MPTRSTLTELVATEDGSFPRVRELVATREQLEDAWATSDDPFAMLLLLAWFHPERDAVELVSAVTRAMAFHPPMAEELERQAASLPGMNYNGPARHAVRFLAQRVRHAPEAVRPALADAVRSVVASPYNSVVTS